MRKIGETELAIATRFFFILDELKERKVIGGTLEFCRNHGISAANLYTTRNNIEVRTLKTEWLAFLVLDYKVSARWLLTGDGEVFEKGSPALY